MNIAICEDERVYLDLIRERTLSFFNKRNTYVKVRCFEDASGLFRAIEAGYGFDLILMDIQMMHSDGMKAASVLRKKGIDTPVIFVTAMVDRAVEGYSVDALDYVVKSRLDERLPQALTRFLRKNRKESIVIPLKSDNAREGKNAVIKLPELLWVESDGRGSRFVTRSGETVSTLAISKAGELLPSEDFVEGYKSVFINISEIKRVGNDTVTMSDDRQLPLSRRKKNDVLCAVLNKVKGFER
ncbi:MAG: response regulator transcription factor [Lachnospiraceae bacterium]|nr:response regulator transcription factor [Lachnospiraceae bacterium]